MISLDRTRLTDNLTTFMMDDNYAHFAELYDDSISTDNPVKIDLINRAINTYNPQAKSLLEIACGTGNILAGFPDFERTGLDLSPNMLTMAATKLPAEVQLMQGDMSNFDLGRQYDVILCIFNSINHLLEFEQWRQTFMCAKRHVKPGGLFIFDTNTRAYAERRVGEIAAIEHAGPNEILANMSWQKPGVYAWNISVSDESGRQHIVTIPESVWPLERIETELAQHFEILAVCTERGERADETADRVYYICQ